MTEAERRVQIWIQARRLEQEAAARVPFCSFDATPELTAGQYRASVRGNRMTVWRIRPK